MGEFDEDFNAETFQQLHLKLLQERDGQWMVREGEGGEAKKEEGRTQGGGSYPTPTGHTSSLHRVPVAAYGSLNRWKTWAVSDLPPCCWRHQDRDQSVHWSSSWLPLSNVP